MNAPTAREIYENMCSLRRERLRELLLKDNPRRYEELASSELVLELQYPGMSQKVTFTEREYNQMDVMMVRKLARQGLAQKRDVLSLRGIRFFKKG